WLKKAKHLTSNIVAKNALRLIFQNDSRLGICMAKKTPGKLTFTLDLYHGILFALPSLKIKNIFLAQEQHICP
ncbi:MAG: hypothetical protein LBS75_00095, partial [Synergistaceae bacterium]|nr:hypothetical protein [Synergistaceae bacterium]